MVIIAFVHAFFLPCCFNCTNLFSSFVALGDEKRDPRKDAFNYYLSQLRIRIEMSFGLLCSKFRILQRPLQVGLEGAGKLLLCCARLHNFAINESIERNADFDVLNDYLASSSATYDESLNAFLPSDASVTSIAGNSIMRDILLERITNLALARPQHNLARNR